MTTIHAQDAQFWNQHYGTKGVLLGGAIIGSVDDLSASFYNPGFLGLRPNPGLSIGTGVFDFTFLSMNNEDILDEPVDRISAQPAPGLVAGQLEIDKDTKNRWTYSLVGRQRFNVLLKGRGQFDFDDGTSASGTIDLVQDLSEYWGGVTWSRGLTEHLGLGATLYGVYRFQRRQTSVLRDSVKNDGRIATVNNVSDWTFWNARFILKTGLFWEEDDWSAGLTVTTAGLSLFGSGNAYGKLVVAGTDSSDALVEVATKSSTTTYRSPWSVGVGVGHRIDNVRLHGSIEWFASLAGYEVMDSPSGSGVELSIRDEMRSIVNFGFGIEVQSTDIFSFYASAVTDMSTLPNEPAKSLGLSSWNIWHFNGGAVAEVEDFQITAGLGLAFGSGLSDPLSSVQDIVFGVPNQTVNVSYLRLRALIGLTYTVSAPKL